MSQLFVSKIGECLKKLNLNKQMGAFARKQINGEMMIDLAKMVTTVNKQPAKLR